MKSSSVCDRCGNLALARIMSRFNTEMICLNCATKEKKHPKYPEAVAAELAALRSGDRYFAGIGLPPDLKV